MTETPRPVNEKRPGRPRALIAAGAVALALIVVMAVPTLLYRPADRRGADADAEGARMELAEIREDAPGESLAQEKARLDAERRDRIEAACAQPRADLDAAVRALEDEGVRVSYIAFELDGGGEISHEPDLPYYSASTIKAPYCIALARQQGADARERYGSLIEPCLVNSDNDAYDALREQMRGSTVLIDFAREAGVSADLTHWYTDYSVRQLARLWAAAAPWLASDDPTANWLAGLLEDTLQSQVDDIAGAGGAVTWSKAGWYAGDPELDTTFDAGIVRAAWGDYAIAVACDRGSDFSAIGRVMGPLVALMEARHAA